MTREFGNTVDYINRKFDLLAYRGAEPVGDTLLSQTLFGTDASGEVCTGVQKLAQRWALHFLTIRGSMPFLPNRGTDFIKEARQNILRNETAVQLRFNVAAVKVRIDMQNEETDDMNDEDRLATPGSELLSIQLFDDRLNLRVKIMSLAGDSRKIILPIPFMPIATTGTL
jgi:hypothetical protein